MKVLMISGDPNILDSNSAFSKRVEEYKNIFGELEILICYGNILNFSSGFWRGFKLLRRNKFDVITAQSPEHWVLGWIFSRFFKIPWQMQIHTDIFSPYFVKSSVFNKIRVLIAKFLIPRVDGIRVVSERIKNSILEKYEKIVILPIFVDTEKIKNSPIKTNLHQKYPEKFIILMASRLTKEKNIGSVLETLSSLIRANKRIVLLIVGNGPEEQKLKCMVNDLDLVNNVVFEPWTNDLTSYYKTCDLFLLTSNYEGYGMTLIEAASVGAKIISSNVGIASEILEKENIFQVGDKNDLIQKLNLAIAGKIKPAKQLPTQTKEEYLRLYKESLEKCIKK
ncbi:MAG: glycosyltransferase [Patescibacteria group bacterium]